MLCVCVRMIDDGHVIPDQTIIYQSHTIHITNAVIHTSCMYSQSCVSVMLCHAQQWNNSRGDKEESGQRGKRRKRKNEYDSSPSSRLTQLPFPFPFLFLFLLSRMKQEHLNEAEVVLKDVCTPYFIADQPHRAAQCAPFSPFFPSFLPTFHDDESSQVTGNYICTS